ncbi:hypothetical protein BDP81DRAFT_396218 [Colletotrichum phormii]|uniref:Uncharacterized protein n=1 Tax=Colletotrichum phormii TaxID=359342 RepID=A0AAJ0ED20_9PEZI|nr:uncharacterized protein BDP81DRAFT_396218 [Colletotrichum phormii]KAK1634223.1 hypothetical protein BDP81DRAFT_396218 [Colletotrichum phormii]
MPSTKDDEPHVDTIEGSATKALAQEDQAYGTVQLLQGGSIVLIPTPNPDPKDRPSQPSDMAQVPHYFFVGSYSAIAVLVPSGLGAVFPSVLKEYSPEDATRATDLLTYPTLFMGIGNLFSMPLCVTIGRRPVFLMSMILLVLSGLWCAFSTSLSSHIAGRNFYSIASGQSEALAPFIIEEIHFLHERGAKLSWFIGLQTVGTAAIKGAVALAVDLPKVVLQIVPKGYYAFELSLGAAGLPETAIAPWEGCGDLYREQFARGGVYAGDLFDELIVKHMLKGRGGIESFREMYARHPLANAWWNDKRPDMKRINVPTYITGTWTNTMHGMGAIRGWLEVQSSEKWLRWHPWQEWCSSRHGQATGTLNNITNALTTQKHYSPAPWPTLYPYSRQEPVGPIGSLDRYFKGLITDSEGFQAFLYVTDFFQKICPRY